MNFSTILFAEDVHCGEPDLTIFTHDPIKISEGSFFVSITALLPGVTPADFFDKADRNDSKSVQDKDKMADPADVAETAMRACE